MFTGVRCETCIQIILPTFIRSEKEKKTFINIENISRIMLKIIVLIV